MSSFLMIFSQIRHSPGPAVPSSLLLHSSYMCNQFRLSLYLKLCNYFQISHFVKEVIFLQLFLSFYIFFVLLQKSSETLSTSFFCKRLHYGKNVISWFVLLCYQDEMHKLGEIFLCISYLRHYQMVLCQSQVDHYVRDLGSQPDQHTID